MKVTHTFFAYSTNVVKVFNCNEIYFQKIGVGNVFINDVFIVDPDHPLYIKCQPGQIDKTPYKITVTGTATCQGFYRMDEGVTEQIQKDKLAASKAIRPNRMRNPNQDRKDRKRK